MFPKFKLKSDSSSHHVNQPNGTTKKETKTTKIVIKYQKRNKTTISIYYFGDDEFLKQSYINKYIP